MTTAERDAKIVELQERDTLIRDAIQKRTEEARRLNDENRSLMQQRHEVRQALHTLKHVKVDDGVEGDGEKS